MSVELDPPELGFRRPFNHEVTRVLTLRNPNSDPVAFKVKTTAPKQYCVRPNSGRIEAGQDVEIQVLLQAMKDDPPMDARCRDKFLVQSVGIAAEQDVGSITSIWQNIEKTAKSSIQERKIRVTFLPSHDSSTPQHNNVNGTHTRDEAPPNYSPSPSFGSPPPDAASPRTHDTSSAVNYSQSRDMNDSTSAASLSKPSSMFNAASSGISTAASNAASSLGISDMAASTGQTLQQQLDSAKATIAQLRKQAEDSGLRQRKSDAVNQDSRERITTGTTGMGVQTQPADGVPVQIVAALCLLSFLLAYFFF
ncbi:phosphatidylinositol-binding protein scs2 [Xylographa carneopallida]|nr:phosphatidylinositol-binding protein scs2 [Xylographa carneopallida]